MKRKWLALVLFTIVLVSGFAAGRASAAQNHMLNALNDLRAAREELDAALADKGGHRANAIKLCNDAIAEVEAGIEYANSHR
jgi:hypothetical protein